MLIDCAANTTTFEYKCKRETLHGFSLLLGELGISTRTDSPAPMMAISDSEECIGDRNRGRFAAFKVCLQETCQKSCCENMSIYSEVFSLRRCHIESQKQVTATRVHTSREDEMHARSVQIPESDSHRYSEPSEIIN